MLKAWSAQLRTMRKFFRGRVDRTVGLLVAVSRAGCSVAASLFQAGGVPQFTASDAMRPAYAVPLAAMWTRRSSDREFLWT